MKGRKDLCHIGKSCGATCIQRLKQCLIELGENLSSSLGDLRNGLVEGTIKVLEKGLDVAESFASRKVKREARQFDKTFSNTPGAVVVLGRGSKFNWNEHTKGSIFAGRGAFGYVLIKGDIVVKRGRISNDEPLLMSMAHKAGAAPGVVKAEYLAVEKGMRPEGRVAMERAKGKVLDSLNKENKSVKEKIANSYWALAKRLHRAGIAHRDLHTGNVFYDPETGKSVAVDFGQAKKSYHQSLAEAMRPLYILKKMVKDPMYVYDIDEDQFRGPKAGFSANRREMVPNFRRLNDNLPKVESFLISNGLTAREIERGRLGALRVGTVKKAIKMLYDGVS